MRKSIAIIFLICWFFIGLGTLGLLGFLIKDFIYYKYCCDWQYFIKMLSAILGTVGYFTLTFLFVIHKDFKKS